MTESPAFPRLIATVMPADPDPAGSVRRMASVGADAVELRIDTGGQGLEETIGAARAAGCAVIACCRRESEGGGWRGGEEDRAALLGRAVDAGAHWIDLEEGSDLPERLGARARGRVILSHHGTIGDLRIARQRLLSHALSCEAVAAKLVPVAGSLRDNVAVRELPRKSPLPFIRFAAGSKGLPSRLMARAWGSSSVYFAADPALPAAEGQIGLSEAIEVFGAGRTDPREPLYGLAGDPIAHSLSPVIHTAALWACRLPGRYLPLETDDAGEALEVAGALGLLGVSVTAPLKETMASRLDELSEESRACGAVNSLVRMAERAGDPSAGRRFFGAMTDGAGILAVLGASCGSVAGARILLLGTGGAARAAALALHRAGARVVIHGRRPERSERVAAATGAEVCTPVLLEKGGWDAVVNATSAGMRDPEELPIPAEAISARVVHDLVYRRDGVTRFVREARRRGIPATDGIALLVEQAVLQFAMWHPRTRDFPAVRRAMGEAAERTRPSR